MEIKVVVPDAFVASDLMWHFAEGVHMRRGPGGTYSVYVEAGDDVSGVVSEIRTWMTLKDVGPVTIHVGQVGETRD